MINTNKIKKAKLRFLMGKDDEVGRILSKKKDEGKEIDDQAIAIAISEAESNTKEANRLKISIAKLKLERIKIAAGSSSMEGSPDGPHFTLTKIKRKGFPEGRGVKEQVGMLRLASEENKFAKYYLLDGLDINGNGWGVTNDSIPTHISSFIGQPFVVTAKAWIANSPYEDQYDHPFVPTNDLNSIFAHQERFRVGEIVKVAKDDDGRWYAMIKKAKQFEDFSFPPFCSPAIYQTNPHEPESSISEWFGLHLAGLMEEPAYGPRVALLKGSCSGTMGQCTHQFRMAKQKDAIGTLEPADIKPIQPIGSSGIKDSEFSDSPFGGDKKKEDKDCDCPIGERKEKLSKLLKGKLGKNVPLKIKISQLKKKKSKYGKHDEEEVKEEPKPKPVVAQIIKAPVVNIQIKRAEKIKDIKKLDGLLEARQELLEDKQKLEARELSKKVKQSMLKTLEAINGDENGRRT